MPGPILTALSHDKPARPSVPRSVPQSSDPAYLVSVGLVAAMTIGVFFGVGFSLLAPEPIIGGSSTRDRGTEVRSPDPIVSQHLSSEARSVPIEAKLPLSAASAPLPVASFAPDPAAREAATPENTNPAPGSVSPATEAAVSATTGAPSSAEAPVERSAAREATLTPPAIVSAVEPGLGSTVATTPAMPPASPRLAGVEVSELLARGDSFILIGDIASARVFYKRAADAGDERAALRMATTFDPAFLRRAGLRGAFGDAAQARSWYRRAVELGASKPGATKITRDTK